MSDEITPFRIAITDDKLEDLKRRLRATRWPERECVDDWTQGLPLAYAQEVASYWLEKYDWRAREALLNRFPQFKTEIDGLGIHFIHVRSPHPDATPLLVTHGWPGSIVEFQKIIEPLTNPTAHGGEAADAFHLVCPSLPGYGFSDKPTRTGWNVQRIANAWSELMLRLGYKRYAAQGGDWGAAITTCIGFQDPANCLGIHVNLPLVLHLLVRIDLFEQRPHRDGKIGVRWLPVLQRLGLRVLQGTEYAAADRWLRPQRLAGRPDGLDPREVLGMDRLRRASGEVLTRDELLDNVMMYWLTESAASSARLYWESFRSIPTDAVLIPAGCSIFPKEIFRGSRRWVEQRYTKLVYFNELDKGGHFAAFEQPEMFVHEVRACFRQIRQAAR